MPNAAAHFDDDFGLEEPARKRAPRRSPSPKTASGKRKKKGKQRFRFAFDKQRVVRYGAIGMSAAIAVGIMVNALMMQKSRHPAPLFGTSIALGQGRTAAHPAPKPAQTPKVVADEAAPVPVAKPRIASRDDTDVSPTSDDAIGRLLQGGAVPAEHTDSRTVLGVQRALSKLGFTVKATGTYGPQTKKALERFEKEHHLPISDDLSRRIVKTLAAESGLKIDR